MRRTELTGKLQVAIFFERLNKTRAAKKVSGKPDGLPLIAFSFKNLRKADCLRRTYIGASATLCACVGINRVAFALRDSANGAFIDTCTASDTIFTNYISHNFSFLICLFVIYNVVSCNQGNFLQEYPFLYDAKIHFLF